MKQFLAILTLAIGYSFNVFSQDVTGDLRPYIQVQDSLLQYLNKDKISTGALLNRPYANVDVESLRAGKDTLRFKTMIETWQQLYLAKYNRNGLSDFMQAYERTQNNKVLNGQISIGYIDFEYDVIDTTALRKGSLIMGDDSLLRDGNGNPYISKKIQMPTLFTEKLRGESVDFYFDPLFSLVNNRKDYIAPLQMELSVANGNKIVLPPGGTANLSLTGLLTPTIIINTKVKYPGGYEVVFPIEVINGNYQTLSSQLMNTCVESNNNFWSGPNLTFQGYNESAATQGMGQYKIYYHLNGANANGCGDKQIRKPIIIMDGIDFQNSKQEFCDDIYNLVFYPSFTPGEKIYLIDSMRHKGYDVIILNFPEYSINGITRDGGTDFIERNGMVLIKLIQYVNERLQASGSTEKICIMGPSMGGQISRFALKYMENHGMNHNTRLFVAFDSPNKGANIPIGLQSAIWYAAFMENSSDAYFTHSLKLRSTAARQMLIHQVRDVVISLNPLFRFPILIKDEYHDRWQNFIDGYGYPNNLRKVALINGTLKGGLGIEPCTYTLNYNVVLSIFGVPISHMAHIRTRTLGAPFTTCNVFDGYKKNNHSLYVDYNSNAYGNIDAAPGGQLNSYKDFAAGLPRRNVNPALTLFTTLAANGYISDYVTDNHTFIPSVSAVGFNNPNFNWADNINRDLVCTGEIPFDNFYAASSDDITSSAINEDHVQLTQKSAKWVMQEIEKGQQNCPPICLSRSQVRNNLEPLCIGGDRIFYHNYNIPSGATLSWDVSENLEIIASNDFFIQVKATDNDMKTYVKAIINNPCGANKVVIFDFVAGSAYNFRVEDTWDHRIKKVYVYPSIPNQFHWSLDGTNNFGHNTSPITVSKDFSRNYVNLWLTASNACGRGTIAKKVWFWDNSEHNLLSKKVKIDSDIQVEVYPNPSANGWNVTLPPNFGIVKEFVLTDAQGRVVWRNKGQTSFVENKNFSNGLYFLRIIGNENTITVKLVKI